MYTVKIIPSYSVVVMYVRMYVCLLQNLYIQLLLMNGILILRNLTSTIASTDTLGTYVCHLIPHYRGCFQSEVSKHFSTTLEHIIVSFLL